MTVAKVAAIRSAADELGISDREWHAFKNAKHDDALAFYVELRRALADEYSSGSPFMLPASDLARKEFMPKRRDRKLYLRLTGELVRLGLIVRVKRAGFSADGRRRAALFMFKTPDAGNVVFLSDRRRGS